jgi:hypothetical protein
MFEFRDESLRECSLGDVDLSAFSQLEYHAPDAWGLDDPTALREPAEPGVSFDEALGRLDSQAMPASYSLERWEIADENTSRS